MGKVSTRRERVTGRPGVPGRPVVCLKFLLDQFGFEKQTLYPPLPEYEYGRQRYVPAVPL